MFIDVIYYLKMMH